MPSAHDIATCMYYTGMDPFAKERGLPNQGYRPGRKTARRLDKMRKRKGGDSEPRP